MRFTVSSLIITALCVLQVAIAMPTQMRMSGTPIQAKKAGVVVPSTRLRQTNWREIQERQEMRKSPLYKRQQPSAVVRRRATVFPDCPAVRGNHALARYPATDIATAVSSTLLDWSQFLTDLPF